MNEISERNDTAASPVFVLCAERTGSTLLRYVLDTHPDLHCPDELFVGQLCATLSSALEGAHGRQGPVDPNGVRQLSAETAEETRALVAAMLESAARAHGKRLWCEKSPANLAELPLLRQVFPAARYICLYRHCLDFVRSCLQACRYGFWPGLAPYVVRSPHNLIDALAQAWLDKTRTEHAFERDNPGRCLHLRYEVLVTAPEPTLRRLCGFIGVGCDPALLSGVFARQHAHRVGHGDENARFSTRIYTSRLALGNELPWRERLSPERIAEVSALLQEVGYPALDPQAESYDLGVEQAAEAGPAGVASVRSFFEKDLGQLIAARPELLAGLSSSFRFLVAGDDGGCWVLDLSGPAAPAVRHDGDAAITISLASPVFLDLVQGRLSASSAYREGALRVEGVNDPAELLKIVHLFSLVAAPAPA